MNKGDRIKDLRVKNGYTMEELAKKLSTTKQTIHKYESGVTTNIPSDKIEIMAKLFNTSPAYLMCWDETDTLRSKVMGRISKMTDEELDKLLKLIDIVRGGDSK